MATKNTGRWMALSTSKKQNMKVRNKVPYEIGKQLPNNLKVMASQKSPTKSTKDLCGYSNCAVGFN